MSALAHPYASAPRGLAVGGPRFVSEIELEATTGISRRTWQKHRLLNTGPRYYKIGSSVRYNLEEVLGYIQAGAVDPGARR